MRKVKSARKLGRTATHRKATLANLSTQLLLHKRIETTEAKAKEASRYVEKIITKAKDGTVHAQRIIFRKIRDKAAIRELFEDIVGKVADRNGGYTRVVKLAPRYGDAAKMAVLELVDYTEAPQDAPQQAKQDRSKRVRGSKKAVTTAPEKSDVVEPVENETPASEKE
ncbi:50S ribosomal protein L17 [Prosthecochloris sp.]|uniref:50S ribosomal protein L17 n=1 Tax=Prosthecochloris sp. TaxID=290513 RepID=UPI0025ED4C7B|nr:50S ribosomal protein L17 [Prosthecochloris sp.]